MSHPADWAKGYARQADADFKAWEYYEQHPEAIAAECHRLMFLQMACEKLCKAYLIEQGTSPSAVQTSHAFVANPLPGIIRQQVVYLKRDLKGMHQLLRDVRHLANEIELLNPAVDRAGRRPDNCEYPWEDGNGDVHSPLDWSSTVARLRIAPGGRTFLKLLRAAIDRFL